MVLKGQGLGFLGQIQYIIKKLLLMGLQKEERKERNEKKRKEKQENKEKVVSSLLERCVLVEWFVPF